MEKDEKIYIIFFFELGIQRGVLSTLICFNLSFNWRKIALQFCVGFFHTTTQISHVLSC